MQQRRRQKNGTTQIFSGLVNVRTAAGRWPNTRSSVNSKPYGHYHCSKYGQGLHQCSMHYIRYDVLYAYVLSVCNTGLYWHSRTGTNF